MGYQYDFKTDLARAKKEEIEAASLLMKQYPKMQALEETLVFNDDNRYDFSLVTKNNNMIKFEVKDDDYTFKSDNVAIETKCRGKKSGISVTEAQFWVHKIRGIFYIFKTSTLRKKVEDREYDRFIDNGGDPGSYTNLCLFKQNKITKWGRPLTGETNETDNFS